MKLIYQGNSKSSGIYKILNAYTNRVYIGQAKSFQQRWHDHKRHLLNGKHQNKFLLNDFNKCRETLSHDNFLEFHVLEVMESSTKEERNKREEWWIAQYYDNQSRCYNFREKTEAKERSCFSLTPKETRQKISEATKKALAAPEVKAKMRTSRIGKPSPVAGMKLGRRSEETKEKLRRANKGQVPVLKGKTLAELIGAERAGKASEQRRIRQLGTKHSEETKQKISRNNHMHGKSGMKHHNAKVYEGFRLQAPDGTIYTKIECLKTFCDMHGLTPALLGKVLKGERTHHKGWKLIT